MNEGYNFLEEIAIADLAYEVRSKTIENLFVLAGKALENAMIFDLNKIEKKVIREFEVHAENLDFLLYNFLQELIFYKDTERLVFRDFDIKISSNGVYSAKVVAYGENIDETKHDTLVDVKAVTMHMFEIKKENDTWYARVILDV